MNADNKRTPLSQPAVVSSPSRASRDQTCLSLRERCHAVTERAFLSPSNIFKAYIDCRKRKRSTVNAQKFERNLCTNIVSLTKSLQSGNYEPGKSICFVVRNPKPREVFAADFKDRIVHHLVVRFLEQHWEKVFIHDSYACRKNKGTLAAVERVAHNMRSITQNGKTVRILPREASSRSRASPWGWCGRWRRSQPPPLRLCRQRGVSCFLRAST